MVLCAALGVFLRVSRRTTLKEVQELEKGSWGAGRGSAGGAHLALSGGGASSPEKPEPRRTGEGWELPAGPGALAPVQAASCREGAAARAPRPLLLGLCRFLYRPAGPLPPATGPSLPGTCQHLPREGAWLRKSSSGIPTRPWCLTPEHSDLSGGAQALGKPSAPGTGFMFIS